MRAVFVKSFAPQREMLLRQPTSVLLRKWVSEGKGLRDLSLLRQLPSYRFGDCQWTGDATTSVQDGALGY